jgi:cyanophycinase
MTTIALLGSGEFEPWTVPVDTWCVGNATQRSDKVLVAPTASAPEGESVFRRWADMGIAHYRAMGLSPELLSLRERDDASRPEIVEALEGASLIFFSGGNPGYLAETLLGTPFWEALSARVLRGEIAFGGCSAGVSFLGAKAPYVSEAGVDHWTDGTELLPRGYVMPHFDALDGYAPGLRRLLLTMKPEGSIVVGIDENTAMFGDGEHWTVLGSGSVWLEGNPDELVPYPDGATLDLRLL